MNGIKNVEGESGGRCKKWTRCPCYYGNLTFGEVLDNLTCVI